MWKRCGKGQEACQPLLPPSRRGRRLIVREKTDRDDVQERNVKLYIQDFCYILRRLAFVTLRRLHTLDDRDGDVDVPSDSLGVGADLFGLADNLLHGGLVDPLRGLDLEFDLEEDVELLHVSAKGHGGLDDEVFGEGDVLLHGDGVAGRGEAG